jgi:hypothetical protein
VTPKIEHHEPEHDHHDYHDQQEHSLLKRWFPHPILSLLLIGQWLALNNSLAPGHVVIGVL